MLMVSLIRWECQLVGLGLYNALAKPIAYAIHDRSHLLVLTHGVDEAPDRRRCTAAAASTHDERCWRPDGALVGKLGPPYMYGPPNAMDHSESGNAVRERS